MKLTHWFESLEVARHFTSELRPHRRRLVLATALALCAAACELLRPWPIQWIFDGALTRLDVESNRSLSFTIWSGVVFLVLISLLKVVFEYARTLTTAKASHLFTRSLRYRLFAHLVRLSPLFHAKHKSGDLLVRLVGDASMVGTMMVESSLEILSRSLFVIGTIVVMLVLDPLLTGAILLALPVLAITLRTLSGRIRIAVRKQRRKEGDLADYLHEAIAATETIQSLGGSEHVVRRFARNNRTSARAGLRAKRIAARLTSSVETVLGIALAGTLAAGSFRVVGGHLSPGELLVFLSYVRSLIKPLRSASKHADRVAKGTACGERIWAVLGERFDVRDTPGAPPAPQSPRELAFENVSFRYGEAAPALLSFSARFQRGQLTALLGRSGAGKSTAASLALRLFDPTEGRVLLDGQPLQGFSLDSVRERVSLCLQDTVLFGESVRENLLLGRPEADESRLWEALEGAGAAEFVRSLADGLDTPLGANGVGLSGGERSRIALARTLLRDAPVLIVDEPFSGLDRKVASEVAKTLVELAKQRIVIVIAHDFERLESFDRVFFLEAGRLHAQGAHAELARIPLYREVVRASGGEPT